MLEHLRLTVPPDLVDDTLALVIDNPCVTNVVRLEGACLRPAADLVECDVTREVMSDLLDDLRHLGLSERGGIVVMTPTTHRSRKRRPSGLRPPVTRTTP